MNDTERLDFLQRLTSGYGRGWVLRQSEDGRGWRLHESSRVEATPDIREAIDKVGHVMGWKAEPSNFATLPPTP